MGSEIQSRLGGGSCELKLIGKYCGDLMQYLNNKVSPLESGVSKKERTQQPHMFYMHFLKQ